MGTIRSLIGGIIGASVGIAIWVAIRYFANYEVGYIAWGIGFLVGAGVHYGATSAGQDTNRGHGAFAALLALGSIGAAKYIAFSLVVSALSTEISRDLAVESDEVMIASLADETAEELEEKGTPVTWPAGMSYEEASKKEDYPPAIWQTAETKWQQLGPEGQAQRRQARAAVAAAIADMVGAASPFSEEFSGWDILWAILAAVTAFRLGSGSYGDDD